MDDQIQYGYALTDVEEDHEHVYGYDHYGRGEVDSRCHASNAAVAGSRPPIMLARSSAWGGWSPLFGAAASGNERQLAPQLQGGKECRIRGWGRQCKSSRRQ